MTEVNATQVTMDEIAALAKRRGFIFPSSEIYGGFAGVYDYGPYGTLLAMEIKSLWWKTMVQLRRDIVGIDSGIFMSPAIWEASGHVKGFSDPLAECRVCHARVRVDHLLEEIGVSADEKMTETQINELFQKHKSSITCPLCGASDFTDARKFNLLVKANLGNFTGDWEKQPVYLRGETCQGIYVNFKNVLDTARVKIPFGIAQIGKAFRNEIAARQYVFRTREFEQMEMQYFTAPDKEMEEYEKLKNARWEYYRQLGFAQERLRWAKHENLVFYAKEAYDIEYRYPFGWKELEGVHARGDYDLSQHSKHSGVPLTYTDPRTGETYIPHVIESSVGVGRTVLAALCDAYDKERLADGGERTVLRFSPRIAPIKVAVFPLLRNKPNLVSKANEVFELLAGDFMCEFDDNGNIGKRYRRQDEIGTPYCVTVDFDTLEDNTVTVRDRDTMRQERVALNELSEYVGERLK